MPQIKINLTDDKESQVQKNIKEDIKYENQTDKNKDQYVNKQIELVWKRFLDTNPDIFKKVSQLDIDKDTASSAGSILIANGLYEEAKRWKDFRRIELKKAGITTNLNESLILSEENQQSGSDDDSTSFSFPGAVGLGTALGLVGAYGLFKLYQKYKAKNKSDNDFINDHPEAKKIIEDHKDKINDKLDTLINTGNRKAKSITINF